MKMIMLLLYDPRRIDPVLDAWQEAGIQEVSVFESSHITRRGPRRCAARYPFGFARAVRDTEEQELTVLGLVPDETPLETCVSVTEKAVGDLDSPKGGLLMSWDLALVKGRILETCPDESS